MFNKTFATLFVVITFLLQINPTQAQEVMSSMTSSTYSPLRVGDQIRELALSQLIDFRSFYNEDGYLIEFQQFDGTNQMHERTNYTVDEDGQVMSTITFTGQGILKRYTNSEFDADGHLVNIKTFNSSDVLTTEQVNVFDDEGNQTSKSVINVPANVTRLTEYIYNDDNELITETVYNPDSSIREIRTYEYDDDGNEIESDLTRPGGEFTRFVSTYDDLDNLLNQKWYDVDGNLINEDSYEYIYDNNDNWTTTKRYTEGEMRQVDERLIGYH